VIDDLKNYRADAFQLIEPGLAYDIFWLLLIVACLVGCATPDYWRPLHEPMLVRGIVETQTPGGRAGLFGYANFATGMIEIKPGLTGYMRECVLLHERKHFSGFSHHDEHTVYAVDCGDGTMAHF